MCHGEVSAVHNGSLLLRPSTQHGLSPFDTECEIGASAVFKDALLLTGPCVFEKNGKAIYCDFATSAFVKINAVIMKACVF